MRPGAVYFPGHMKVIILLVLAALALVAGADDTEDDPTPITKDEGLKLTHRHPGDIAWIHVTPIPENARRVGGWLQTTNTILTLGDCSMFPEGLNRLEVRTISRGMTGEVATALVDVQRPPPAPKLSRAKIRRSATNSVPVRLAAQPPAPPLPPGFVPPLPGGATDRVSYHDFQLMQKYYSKTGRRNQ